MRVAVTTNDLVHVDASFGRAHHLVIYEVRPAGVRRRQAFDFPARAGGCDGRALAWRAAALKGCLVVCTLEIGGAGRALAARQGAAPVLVARPRPIAEVLETLRAALAGPMRPWVRRALRACPARGGGG